MGETHLTELDKSVVMGIDQVVVVSVESTPSRV